MIQVDLEESTAKHLMELAETRGQTVNEVIEYLLTEVEEAEWAKKDAIWKQGVGMFDDDVADLSSTIR